MASWKQSVTKARTALLKTFEGRMIAAEASFEQVPRNGKGANGSLAEFARDVGVELQTITNYRAVYKWIGDSTPLGRIGSWSVAREAHYCGKYRTAAEFVEAVEKTEKVVRIAGFEPYFFDEWTVDTVRAVLLGQEPKATLKVQMTAIETGEDPIPEVLDEAEQNDLIEDTLDRVPARKMLTAVLHRLHADESISQAIETPLDTAVATAELERWVAEGDLIISRVEDRVAAGQVDREQLIKPADDTEALAHRLRTAHERQADFDRGLEDLLRQGA